MGDHIRHGAVRRSYDTVAEEYTKRLHDELAGKPLDRALLAALLEQTEPGTALADLGCGPGHIAAHLASAGTGAEARDPVHTVGIDLSEGMLETGRNRYPGVEFRNGDLLALPAGDGEFGAAVALYSFIHLSADELPTALAEARRVLRPGGLLLLAFHIGEETRHLDEWWGHEVDVDFHFHDPVRVGELLEAAGFAVQMRMERRHYAHEADTRRAYLLARRA
ncbi:methyltransferase domain-containing protein [Streptomyces sp. NPDC004111]|uniref:class I SAM-dependent methyltransferase n=1 Tax=Streptomyces sp. NPDC004111 TaxID=3364690 RepID=UPI0036A82B8E